MLPESPAISPTSNPLNGSSLPRVLRLIPDAYGHLETEHSLEHDAWRERQHQVVIANRKDVNDVLRARLAVDELSVSLLRITLLLRDQYGTPDLGNKADPVDELVYIILSRRTREGAYQAAFTRLRSCYQTWEALADASTDEVEDAIRFSGLGRRKAQSLKLALSALIDSFGCCTLEPTRSWGDEEVLAFLCGLPEIGPKSAACVMMCSLDRRAHSVGSSSSARRGCSRRTAGRSRRCGS